MYEKGKGISLSYRLNSPSDPCLFSCLWAIPLPAPGSWHCCSACSQPGGGCCKASAFLCSCTENSLTYLSGKQQGEKNHTKYLTLCASPWPYPQVRRSHRATDPTSILELSPAGRALLALNSTGQIQCSFHAAAHTGEHFPCDSGNYLLPNSASFQVLYNNFF